MIAFSAAVFGRIGPENWFFRRILRYTAAGTIFASQLTKPWGAR
jgi:hypothetical protein